MTPIDEHKKGEEKRVRAFLAYEEKMSDLIHITPTVEYENPKCQALEYILEAWDEALSDGVEADKLANAALFAALSDLVSTYGEHAVAKMARGLSNRIERGDFTLNRTTQ